MIMNAVNIKDVALWYYFWIVLFVNNNISFIKTLKYNINIWKFPWDWQLATDSDSPVAPWCPVVSSGRGPWTGPVANSPSSVTVSGSPTTPPPTVMWTTNFPFQVPFLRLQLGLLLPFYCLIDLQFSTISCFNYFLWKRIYFIIKEYTSQDGLVVAIDKGW